MPHRRLALAGVALAVLAGPAAGSAQGACTPFKATAYDDVSQNSSEVIVEDTNWQAQSFQIAAATTLNKLTLFASNFGDTGDSATVQIWTEAGGQPGVLLGTRTRLLTDTTTAFRDFDFSADGIRLAPATTYFIVFSGGTAGLGNKWGSDDSAPGYAEGSALTTNNSGASWASTGPRDMLFRVWGQTCTADPAPGGGGGGNGNGNGNANIVKAALSQVAFSSRTFAAESSGPSATTGRKRRAPKGTRVSYTLNEAASVRFTVKRRAKGRRVGRRCVKPTRKNRRKRRCTRYVAVRGNFTLNGVAGPNSFHFTGRLRGRKLKPGRYRLVATPSVGGVKGKAISTAFRIVR